MLFALLQDKLSSMEKRVLKQLESSALIAYIEISMFSYQLSKAKALSQVPFKKLELKFNKKAWTI